MTNNSKLIFAKSLDIAKRLFLCTFFCLISNYVAAWTEPNDVSKTITVQVGSSVVVNPRGAVSVPDNYIWGAGLGNYDKTGLSITVSSTKTVTNTASNSKANYYTYKIQGNKVGTYTVKMSISYYYKNNQFILRNGSVAVNYTINVVDVTSIDIPSNLSLKFTAVPFRNRRG